LNRKQNDHERGRFFLFLIYQEQAIGLSFKKQWCIWRSHLCPLACWLYKSRWSANVRCRCSLIW
jgi:hypothetical protein